MTVHKDFPLSEVLWYRIGGACKYLLECRNKEDIAEALELVQKNTITKFHVIGLGTNILFLDEYFDGAVIHLMREPDSKHIHLKDNNKIEAFAGELIDDVIHESFKNNLVGLEWAGGLPGTVGGGIRGNAGAFGSDIASCFYSAEVLEIEEGGFNTKILHHEQMNFGYRSSTIKQQKNLILLSAIFEFQKADSMVLSAAKATYQSNFDYRKKNHPLEYPSCGSTFKNIIDKAAVEKIKEAIPDLKDSIEGRWHGKVSMGALITYLGLSGYQVGNAKASEKHPNFIVNLGGAKASDVLGVIHKIKDEFHAKFGFEPEVEIEIIE